MSHFIVSFRIHSDSNYQQRYESLVSRISEVAGGVANVWEETSAFYAFEANGTAQDVCDDLYYNSSVADDKDLILVINLDKRQKFCRGPVLYKTMLERTLGF